MHTIGSNCNDHDNDNDHHDNDHKSRQASERNEQGGAFPGGRVGKRKTKKVVQERRVHHVHHARDRVIQTVE